MVPRRIANRRSLLIALALFGLSLSLSTPSQQLAQAKTMALAGGRLTIHSTGLGVFSSAGMAGHAWVEYTPDGGQRTTYGNFERLFAPLKGINVDVELNRNLESEVSRTANIDAAQAQAFMGYVISQIARGPDAYGLINSNCSNFASNAWRAATGETISPGNNPSTPAQLRDNIRAANGGETRGNVNFGANGGVESGPPRVLPRATKLGKSASQQRTLFNIQDVLPVVGPQGTAPVFVTPTLTIELGNAVEARAVDFRLDPTQETSTVAVVLVTRTLGETYWHDYSICSRFHGYALESLVSVPVIELTGLNPDGRAPQFWYGSAEKGNTVEESLVFSVFVNETERRFEIDSQWISTEYACHWRGPIAQPFDYVLNYQIWTTSTQESYKLLQGVFERLSAVGSGWTMDFVNDVVPTMPTLAFNSAGLSGDKAQATVQSWMPDPSLVLFHGTKRLCKTCEDIPFEYWEVVNPNLSFVKLPLGNIANAVIYSDANGFTDKIFVSTEGSSPPSFHSVYLPTISKGGLPTPPQEPSIDISWPPDNALVTVEKDLTDAVDDYRLTIHGTVHGYETGWTILVEVFTNAWYPQAPVIVRGDMWGVRAYLAGQGAYNNHKIRATLKDASGRVVATDIVNNIVRTNPCQTR